MGWPTVSSAGRAYGISVLATEPLPRPVSFSADTQRVENAYFRDV
jgi:hypothetical protein